MPAVVLQEESLRDGLQFGQIGAPTGIDFAALCRVVVRYETLLNRRLPGRMSRVIRSAVRCPG